MRIDAATKNPDLLEVITQLIADGAVIDVLTSDLEAYVTTGLRYPTVIYRPDVKSVDHVWLDCPVIDAKVFDIAMDKFNAYWGDLQRDPSWQRWIVTHPVAADVLAA